MARYREKDETDLRWNRIRRRLTRELDTHVMDWREEALNDLLSGAWDAYVKSMETGQKLELEADYKDWVTKSLDATAIKVQATPDALE
jgi:hypothetical protein